MTKYVFRKFEAGFFDKPKYQDTDYYNIEYRGRLLRCRKMFLYRNVVLWLELDMGYECLVFRSAESAATVIGDLECLSVVCDSVRLDEMVAGKLVEGSDRIRYCRELRERSEQDSFSWNGR